MKTTLNKVLLGELFWLSKGDVGYTLNACVRLLDSPVNGALTYLDSHHGKCRGTGADTAWVVREEELSRWDWPEVRLVELLDIAKGIETHVDAPAVVAGMPVDDLWEINLAMVRYGSRFGEALGDSQYIYCLISDELEERGAKCNRG